MSVSKYFWHENVCDHNYCCGDCDLCDIPRNPEQYGIYDEDDEEIDQEITALRKGEE